MNSNTSAHRLAARGLAALGLTALALAAGLGGCQRSAPPGDSHTDAVRMGTYRAVLTLPGGELPFGLVLTAVGPKAVGYLVNGKERVELDEVSIAGAHL